MSKEPKNYTTLYTCVACRQIQSYKEPSELNVQETVQKYTEILQKLVTNHEHKPGTKRILFELSSFMSRIQRYLEIESVSTHIFNSKHRYEFKSCTHGLTISPLESKVKLEKSGGPAKETTPYIDDIIISSHNCWKIF